VGGAAGKLVGAVGGKVLGKLTAKACSFAGTTTVLMADGSHKPIQDIRVGDEVIATDPETDEQAAKAVEHVFVHDDTLVDLRIDGETIATTEDHPFWSVTDQRFERADELAPGELLLKPDGRPVQTSGLEWHTAAQGKAFNLEIEGIHTYYVLARATPILVHNACGKAVAENMAGRFGDLSPGRVGDGLEAHHMPQAALGFLSRNEGGAIVMKAADHALTRTYKSLGRATKAAESGLSFRTVLARDIWDLRRIGEQQYGDPGHYNPGIRALLSYYREIGML